MRTTRHPISWLLSVAGMGLMLASLFGGPALPAASAADVELFVYQNDWGYQNPYGYQTPWGQQDYWGQRDPWRQQDSWGYRHDRRRHGLPDRYTMVLQAIGIALGGKAGVRLAAHLQLTTSPSALLRLVRAAPIPHTPALQAVGVDEWAWPAGSSLWHDPGRSHDASGRGPPAGPLSRQCRGLAGPAPDGHRGLSRPEPVVCGWHPPGSPCRGAGRRSFSSGGQPPQRGRSILAEPAGGPSGGRRAHSAGADATGELGAPHAHVSGAASEPAGPAASDSRWVAAPTCALGRDLCHSAHAARAGPLRGMFGIRGYV
jgi:hypothetical protein